MLLLPSAEKLDYITDMFGYVELNDLVDSLEKETGNLKVELKLALRRVNAMSKEVKELKRYGFSDKALQDYKDKFNAELRACLVKRNAINLVNRSISPYFNEWLCHIDRIDKFKSLITGLSSGKDKNHKKIIKMIKLMNKLSSDEVNLTVPFVWQQMKMVECLKRAEVFVSTELKEGQIDYFDDNSSVKSSYGAVVQNATGSAALSISAKRKEKGLVGVKVYKEQGVVGIDKVRIIPAKPKWNSLQLRYKAISKSYVMPDVRKSRL